jgi:type I restriction enzyme, S subunit
MKWEKVKLGDICKSIADGDHQAPKKQESGVPFITISNIDSNNRIDFTNCLYVSKEYYDAINDKRKARKDDILYSVVGSFGVPVLIKENLKFAFQRHIAILRPDKDKIFPAFMYYCMVARVFYLQADSVAIGSAQRTITLGTLNNMQLTLPALPIQKRIASILSAYDDLIENNQKQIKLLEEAAYRKSCCPRSP